MRCNIPKEQFVENVSKISGYDKYKNALYDDYYKAIYNDDKLAIISAGTGIGKSHTAAQIIAKICEEQPDVRCFYVTQRHANLPSFEALETANNGFLKNKISYILSKTDNILDVEKNDAIRNFIDGLPRNDDGTQEIILSGERLLKKIEVYNKMFVYGKLNAPEYQKYAYEEIGKLDSEFLFKIKSYVSKLINKNISLEEGIRELKKIQGFENISQIYPHLDAVNSRLVILTLSKFMKPIDFIISSYSSFIESPLVNKKTIIILDESDEAYRIILEDIIEQFIDDKNDLHFIDLLQAITKGTYSKNSFLLSDNEKTEILYNEIKESVKILTSFDFEGEKYDISNYSIRDCTEEKGGKIFTAKINNKNINVQILGEDNGEIKYSINPTLQKIDVHINPSNENNDNDFKELISILYNSYNTIKKSIFSLANIHYDKNRDEHLDWTRKTSLTTILNDLICNIDMAELYASKLSSEYLSFITEKSTNNIEKLSNSFSIFKLSAHKEIKGDLKVELINCDNTPEKELARMIEKSLKVVLMSATSTVKSSLCNFDLEKVCEYFNINYNSIKQNSEELYAFKNAIEYTTKKHDILTNILSERGSKDADRERNIKKMIKEIRAIMLSNDFIKNYNLNKDELKHFLNTTIKNASGDIFERERAMFSLLSLSIIMSRNFGMSSLFFFNKKITHNTLFCQWIEILNKKVFPQEAPIKVAILQELKDSALSEKIDSLFIKDDEFLPQASVYVYLTTFGSFATGGNAYQLVKGSNIDFSSTSDDETKKFFAKIPDLNRLNCKCIIDDEEIYKADVDAIYIERKTNLIPRVDETLEGLLFINDIKRMQLKNMYHYNALYLQNLNDKYIPINSINKDVSEIMKPYFKNGKNNMSRMKKKYEESNSIQGNALQLLIQVLGRIPRNAIGSKFSTIIAQTGQFTNKNENYLLGFLDLEKYGFDKKMTVTPIISSIIKELERKQIEFCDFIDNPKIEKCDKVRQTALDELEKYRKGKREDIEKYRFLKNGFLSQNFTLSEEEFQKAKENDKRISSCYIDMEEAGYTYDTIDKITSANWISEDKEIIRGKYLTKEELQVDLLNKLFGENFVHFDECDDYILNPAIADMEKGDLGERIFNAIPSVQRFTEDLEKSKKELFDFHVKNTNKYIDIKFHNSSFDSLVEYMEKELPKIKKKLEAADGDCVLILNVYPSNTPCIYEKRGRKVSFLDGLFMKDGSVSPDALRILIDFITIGDDNL